MQTDKQFLKTLQAAAREQSPLSQTRVLPPVLDRFSAFVGNYPWQTIVVLSGVTALIVEIMGKNMG